MTSNLNLTLFLIRYLTRFTKICKCFKIMKTKVELTRKTLGKNPFDSTSIQLVGNHPSYFVKIFTGSANSILLDSLTDKTKALFLWMIMEVELDIDYICIDKKRYMEETGVKSYTTCFNAIKELISKQIIAPTAIKNVYWINTSILFKGTTINN